MCYYCKYALNAPLHYRARLPRIHAFISTSTRLYGTKSAQYIDDFTFSIEKVSDWAIRFRLAEKKNIFQIHLKYIQKPCRTLWMIVDSCILCLFDSIVSMYNSSIDYGLLQLNNSDYGVVWFSFCCCIVVEAHSFRHIKAVSGTF